MEEAIDDKERSSHLPIGDDGSNSNVVEAVER